MSDLSYLDTISNKELHAKCLQYGLPNIPVTDSSRQVIVRRLRATILGVPLNKSKNATSATKKTPRRETIHSSKATPTTEMGRVNANVNINRVAGKSPSRNNNNNNTRRTIAAAPGNYYPLENSSVRSMQTTTTVSDIGSQSEDDDFYTGNSPSFKYSNGAQREDERLRRSVSLTKSGVLTTSYTREVNQPQYEEDDKPQSHTYQRPHVAPAHTLPSYEPHVERTYSSALPRQQLSQSLLNSTSYSEDTPDYSEQPILQRNTYNGSAAPFHAPAVASTASIRQRQTTGGSGFARGRLIQPTYKVNTLYPQLNEFYDQRTNAEEPMDLDTDSEPEVDIQQQRSYGSTVESPYLSSFSRQLNAGKRSSPLARPQKRQTIAKADVDSPMEQFRVFFRSMDQKYHLKFYFLLTLAVIFTTLVYVVLTP